MIDTRIKGKKVLILGLGRANLSVARYLLAKGAELYLYEENFDKLSPAARRLVNSANIKNYQADKYHHVITSPGFPINKPIIHEIQSNNNVVIDEIEFTYEQLGRPAVIAVTGTNGKSTTVAIIDSILTKNNVDHFTGGNIAPGKPFSEALFMPHSKFYILEISSFQLMRIINFKPYIGLITNITLDHLNWHRDFNEYLQAKLRIFKNQDKNDYAVLNANDPELKKISGNLSAKTILFGYEAWGGSWLNGYFHFGDQKLFSKDQVKIVGRHNQLNIMAAIAVAKILELEDKKIEDAIANFGTLPHRLEEVAEKKGVRFINNSMCTNEVAAIESFKALSDPKIVIVGGKEKGDTGINYLELLVHEAKFCVVLGDNSMFIDSFFRKHHYTNYKLANDMREAVIIAQKTAQPGDIVLLNPGYASFDFYMNFEDRGEAFRKAVHET